MTNMIDYIKIINLTAIYGYDALLYKKGKFHMLLPSNYLREVRLTNAVE